MNPKAYSGCYWWDGMRMIGDSRGLEGSLSSRKASKRVPLYARGCRNRAPAPIFDAIFEFWYVWCLRHLELSSCNLWFLRCVETWKTYTIQWAAEAVSPIPVMPWQVRACRPEAELASQRCHVCVHIGVCARCKYSGRTSRSLRCASHCCNRTCLDPVG